jgi:hopanoid-associated phosphorylase
LPIVGIVTGLEFEADVVRRHARFAGVADRVLVAAGVGRERARRLAQALLADGATTLLSFGIAGGLSPDMACGTTVVATAVKAENMETISCSAAWTARLAAALQSSPPFAQGELAYAPIILITSLDKSGTFAATSALAADMESYGVGEAALKAGVPFAAVRVVADTAGEQLPEIALHAMAPDGSLKLAETLSRIVRSPGQIPGLIRLGRSTARARRRLGEVAALGARGAFFSEP